MAQSVTSADHGVFLRHLSKDRSSALCGGGSGFDPCGVREAPTQFLTTRTLLAATPYIQPQS